MRAANDSSGSLTNRLVTITGFVLNEPGGADLARIVIICCAADAHWPASIYAIMTAAPPSGSLTTPGCGSRVR
jgi:uncharacterized membrane protein YcgQ (UPF0703/DUF1980 family)